jgi:acyl-homoserine-lactone acylase
VLSESGTIGGRRYQCFQSIQAADDTTSPLAGIGPYGQVTYGSSLVMTTQLTKRGPRAQAILTYSQATDPTSPWYINMTRLFAQKRWVTMRYTHAELARDPHAREVKIPGAADDASRRSG